MIDIKNWTANLQKRQKTFLAKEYISSVFREVTPETKQMKKAILTLS